MIKKLSKTIITILLMVMLFSSTAYADMGPKPSVEIEFLGMGGKTVYATLLSSEEYYGPYVAYQGDNPMYTEDDRDYPIWEKFVRYTDQDGFYFLQNLFRCDIDNNSLYWGYFPPEPFKLLVYYPDTDTFVESPVYSRYAFNSKYIAPLNEAKDGHFELAKSYDYTKDFTGFAVRLIGTVAIEMLVAVLFGYTEKKAYKFIAVVNIVTQFVLNIILAWAIYSGGAFYFALFYILGEAVVFLAESVLYAIRLPKLSQKHKGRLLAIIYAIIANALSLAVGFYSGLWLSVL